MKTAIWTEHFADLGIETALKFTASLGYEAVEITPWLHDGPEPTMSEETIEQITTAVDRHGLEVAGTARGFGPVHDHLVNSPDETERERVGKYLEELVVLCDELGGSVIPFGAGAQRHYPDDVSYGTAWEYALEVFGHDSLLETLETRDVTISIEPLSESATNFLNTTPETLRFVEEVGHPNVAMTIDSYHLVNEPGSVPELIRECREHLVEFHADDPSGFGPGSGDQDYNRIYDTLDEVGFDGYVTVEFHAFLGDEPPEDDTRELAERSLSYLESCWP